MAQLRHDPDRLAIVRQRRQSGRCAACGHDAGRAALCTVCARHHSYCPRCEQVIDRIVRPSFAKDGRTSVYCNPCHLAVQRAARYEGTRRVYLEAARARRNPHLDAIIDGYRAGLTRAQIAAAVGIPLGTVGSIIDYAKKKKQWPRTLRRQPGERTDLRQKLNAIRGKE